MLVVGGVFVFHLILGPLFSITAILARLVQYDVILILIFYIIVLIL